MDFRKYKWKATEINFSVEKVTRMLENIKRKEKVFEFIKEHKMFDKELGVKEQEELLQFIRLTYGRNKVSDRNKNDSPLFRWLRYIGIIHFEKASLGRYYIEIPQNCNFEDLCKRCYKGKCPYGYIA